MKKCALIFFALSILSLPSLANGNDDASAFLKGKLDAVIEVLQTPGIDQNEKREKVIGIIMPVFNMPLIAKLAVGKKYWPRFSDEQKTRFTRAFTNRLQRLYISKIMLYTDERVVYKTPVTHKNKVHIPTDLISNGSRYGILYKMYRSQGNWHIYDIELARVSILKSFRSQIHHVLNTGSFQDLIGKMEASPVDGN